MALTNSLVQQLIPKPFGRGVSSKLIGQGTLEMDPITGEIGGKTIAQSRNVVQGVNPSDLAAAEASRDTLFGRIAKRVTGYLSGESYEDEYEDGFGDDFEEEFREEFGDEFRANYSDRSRGRSKGKGSSRGLFGDGPSNRSRRR